MPDHPIEHDWNIGPVHTAAASFSSSKYLIRSVASPFKHSVVQSQFSFQDVPDK